MTDKRGGKRPGAGRPRKSHEEKQIDFNIAVSGKTYDAIDRAAEVKSMSIRQYLRLYLENKFT